MTLLPRCAASAHPSEPCADVTGDRAKQITQSIVVVLAAVFLSRALGFLREWMVAREIGSGPATDAYYAAFTLPDFLNYLVASSALEVILVPIFTTNLADNRADEAWHVFSTVVTCVTILVGTLILTGELFTVQIVRLLVPGFTHDEMAQVVFLTRLMLPAQLFLCLGVVFCSAQVAHTRFLISCLGAAVSNCGIILAGWLLAPRFGITGFAFGVLAGSFCGFFLLQIVGLHRIGARFRPNLDFRHPGFRMFLRLAIPFMLALSIVVTDDWMLRWFGSFLQPASITWLTYAKMLARIPLSTIGYAVGLASFPYLAQLYSEGKLEDLNYTLNHAAKALLLILVPVSVFAVVLHVPLVQLIFSHTRMRAPDLEATASTLAFFAMGIAGFGVQNLIARGFYATRDTVTPAVVGSAFTFGSIPLYWYLGRHWKHLGLAAASSLSISLFTLVMFALLMHRTGNRERGTMARFTMKVALASACSGLACCQLTAWIESRLAWKSTMGALILLTCVSLFGFVLYLLLVMALRVGEVSFYCEKVCAWLAQPRKKRACGKQTTVVFEGE